MAIKIDRGKLTKELKAATKGPRYFVYAPGKTPDKSVLIVSKKPITASDRKQAKTDAKATKVFGGSCFKDGTELVFECDREFTDTFSKNLKQAIKKLTDFVPPKVAARLAAAGAGGAGGDEKKVPKLPDEKDTLDVAKGLEKLGVEPPSFGTKDSDDPAVQTLKDTEKDLKKAKEYVDYITKALKYVETSGDATGLENVSKASKQLGTVTKRVSSAVGKAGDKVAKAKKIADWLVAIRDFVDASDDLDVESRNTFRRWGKTLERLFDTSSALVDWSKMVNAAAAGSYTAGVAFFTLAFVGSQVFIGIKTLNQGIENVDAYFDRMNRVMRESEFDATGRPPKGVEKPDYPGDYVSPEEEAKHRKERREWDRKKMEESQRRRERFDLTEQFKENVFPKIYMKRRPFLIRDIWSDVDAGKPGAPNWAAEFMPGRGEPEFRGGVYVQPPKLKVSLADVKQEIVQFRGVMPPCPHFEELHKKSLEAYIRKQGGK
jgi:hypothetical protein